MECGLLIPIRSAFGLGFRHNATKMRTKALLVFRGTTIVDRDAVFSYTKSSLSKVLIQRNNARFYVARSGLEPPDVAHLAGTARISLTPREIKEFAPKIQQVVDWFGQLQAVDLQTVEPAIRADTEGEDLRDDLPEIFENEEAMIHAVPNYEEPYIKVPKILNKE